MNDISSIFQGYMLEARSQAIGEIQLRKRVLQAQKEIIIKVAASVFGIKSHVEIPDSIQDHLDPINKELDALVKAEQIIGYEIYDLVKRADEIIAFHEGADV